MATDSTELTFVRCPSCRSLVPAVSTRCRMCGAGLDASGEGEDLGSDQKKSGRVRQRTMSQPQSELNSAVSKLRASEGAGVPSSVPEASPPVEPMVTPVAAASALEEPESMEDPLSAYIEEVDEQPDPGKTMEKQSPVVAPPHTAVEHNGNGHARVENSEPAPIPQVTRPVEQSIPAAQILSARQAVVEQPAAVVQPEPVEMDSADSSDAPKGFDEKAGDEKSSGQRVIVESGLRRHGKPSGLSFSRGRDEPRPQSGAQAQPQPERPQSQPKAAAPIQQERQQARQEHVERPEGVQFSREERRERQAPPQQQAQPQRQRDQERREDRREDRREERREQQERREPERREQQRERSSQPAARPSEGTKRAEQAVGRLFGWLVNYSHPDGIATELREGKFFVTASSLKASDLIVEEPSISTPHALVSVSVELGLQVQDLMSDRGVFVRRRGDDSYRREADVVQVEHGDWVRFGDVEYLVSLIAHVGAK